MAKADKIQKGISDVTKKMKSAPNKELPAKNAGVQGPQSAEVAGDKEGTARKAELQKMFEDVKNKDRQVRSSEIIEDNKVKQQRFKFVQGLFKIMVDNGVDPNNLESIQEFLKKLEFQDPDLLELFQFAFNELLGAEESPGSPTGPQADLSVGTPSPGDKPIMERFSNLAQPTMMPRGDEAAPPVAPPAAGPPAGPAPAPIAPTAPVAPPMPPNMPRK